MNKLGWHWWPSDTPIATDRIRRPRAVHQSRPLHAGLRAGREGEHRHHLLAACDPRRGGTAAALPGAGDHDDEHGMASGAIYYDADGHGAVPAGGNGDPRLQRRRHAAAAAEFGVGRFPNGLANSSDLVGKNLMLHPWPQVRGYVEDRWMAIAARRLPVEPGVLRDRSARGASCAATFCSSRAAPGRRMRRSADSVGHLPWGEDHHASSVSLLSSAADRHRLRGSARRAQPGHSRSGAEGQPWHSRRRISTTRSARTRGG